MTKISINQNECAGCGFCAGCASEIFAIDEKEFKAKIEKDGKLVDGAEIELSVNDWAKLREAADGCPVKAIKLSE